MAITKVSPGLLDLDSGITITTADNSDNLTLVSTDTDAAIGPNINLYRNAGNGADADNLSTITFAGNDDAGNATDFYRITAQIDDASNGSEDVFVYHRTMVGGTERLRLSLESDETVINEEGIDLDFRVESDGNANGLILRGSDGAVGISTSPNAWETGTGGRQPIQVGFGSISGRLNDLHTEFTNNAYAVGTGNSPQWAGITRWSKNQIALGSNGEIYFNTSPAVAENTFNSSPNFSWTNMLTLQSTGATLANGLTLTDGDLTVASGHGINFAATGGPTNGSGNSELLDDYEEGTFTPAFAGSGGNPTVSYQTQQGRYTKIGNLVHVQIRLQTMSVSGGSGNLSITGLPFASATTSGTGSGFSKAFIYNWSTDPETFFTGGDTNIAIYSSDANNTQAQVSHLNTASGPVNYTVIDGTYQV